MNQYYNYEECENGFMNSYKKEEMNSDWNPGVFGCDTNKSVMNDLERLPRLYSPYEAYQRGNLFPGLYQGYQGINPSMTEPKNQRMELLSYLGAYAFAAHELNLYLDNYPNDREAVKKFKEYKKEVNKAKEEYEKLYGPITVTGVTQDTWTWVNEPWPWENK